MFPYRGRQIGSVTVLLIDPPDLLQQVPLGGGDDGVNDAVPVSRHVSGSWTPAGKSSASMD
jgi:hypothetical protein